MYIKVSIIEAMQRVAMYQLQAHAAATDLGSTESQGSSP
jgi:hypothetical protein